MASLTEAQKEAIRSVPRLTAALSIAGSGSILCSIFRKVWKGEPEASLGRSLLLGLSLADFLSSLSYVVGDIAFPEGVGAGKGTQATCNLQGFFCNLQVGAAIYSGFLAWYYCFFIRYHWRRPSLKYVEQAAHLLSWGFVLSTGCASIAKHLYNPHWIRCYIAGPGSNPYFWGFFYAPIWLSMICGSIAMFLIYLYVRNIEARSLQHTFERSALHLQQISIRNEVSAGVVSGVSSIVSNDLPTMIHLREDFQRSRSTLSDLPKTQRVANQGLSYTVAFILCYTFPTTSRIWQTACCDPPYPIRLLATSFVGSQGFWNSMVYYVLPHLQNYWARRQRKAAQVIREESSKDEVNWHSSAAAQEQHQPPPEGAHKIGKREEAS